MTHTLGDLHACRRGAIMVCGTFMACFLVGAIWYAFGVGSSILYRERVQDAADAVVFAGAVYHARGMNIIVTLNILMAALLGLVVVARLARFVNDSANVISCGCTAVPFIGGMCGAVCGTTRGLREPLRRVENGVTNLYNRVGPALSSAQRGVAIAMPWVAQAKAIGVSLDFRPDVRFGAIASLSMVRVSSDGRLGLPVQEGDDAVLCGKVSSGITDLVLGPFDGLPLIGGWFESRVNDFVSGFCGGDELIDPEEAREIEESEERDQIDRQCDWQQATSAALDSPLGFGSKQILQSARRDHASGEADLSQLQCFSAHTAGMLSDLPTFGQYASGASVPASAWEVPGLDYPITPAPDPNIGCPFDRGRCEREVQAEIRRRREAAQADGGAPSTELDPDARERTTPKIVYGPAANGDHHFQVWSLVYADNRRATEPARGVAVAAHHGERAERAAWWSRLGWAQAEFYYDHEGPWTEEISVNQAMWNLRWRARLRRVRPPTVNLLEELSNDLLPRLRSRIEQMLDGPPDSETEGDAEEDEDQSAFQDFAEALVRSSFDEIADDVQSDVTARAVQGDDAIERRIRNFWSEVGGIH